jgi:hypothetical protein
MTKGIPAFPVVIQKDSDIFIRGMTLRDWFAGQALLLVRDFHEAYSVSLGTVAADAYELADAMLAEREKPRGEQKND